MSYSSTFMNRNISTVALISCLLITTCLAGCLEDDDGENTKSDFYGEEYWAVNGFAYTFEEDGVKYTLQKIDDSCDDYEGSEMGELIDSSGDYCILELDFYDYSSEDEGDYYEICLKEDSDSDDDCINVYPLSDGMVIENDDDCSIFVSDISRPTLVDGELEEDWEDDWMNAAEEIYNDDDAPNCEYDMFLAPENEDGGLSMYQFDGRDAAGPITDDTNTQDDLVYVQMTQGDPLSWSVVRISIVVDGGPSHLCGEEWNNDSACTYTVSDDKHWEVPYEILISEGNENLCAPSSGKEYCDIDVTITKMGVGGEDDRVLYSSSMIAE